MTAVRVASCDVMGSHVAYWVLLAAAFLLPAVHPGGAVLKAVAIMMVVAMWIRVARSGPPETAAQFLQPVIVIAGAVLSWLVIDRALPRGHGLEQAVLALALTGGMLAYLLIVDRVLRMVRERAVRRLAG